MVTKEEYFSNFNKKIFRQKQNAELCVVTFTNPNEGTEWPRQAIMKEFPFYNEKFREEALNLQKAGRLHQNIVKIYHYTCFEGKFRIFMEKCVRNLSEFIKRTIELNQYFSQSLVFNFSKCLIEAIRALHHNDIVHRDIKPDNIFVTNVDELRLGDFGTAKEMRFGNSEHTITGTLIYMSPRLVQLYAENNYSSSEIDPCKEDV